MSEALDELLHALRAAAEDPAVDTDSLVDAIETLIADDPEGSRAVVLGHTGDEMMRIWALGLFGDPVDFDHIAAALADPDVRAAALEALANQPDVDRVDAVARLLLDDPDPMVRSRAIGMVAFRALPGALAALVPLAEDPVARVRMVLGWRLGALGDPAAEPTLRILCDDPEMSRCGSSLLMALPPFLGRAPCVFQAVLVVRRTGGSGLRYDSVVRSVALLGTVSRRQVRSESRGALFV